MNNTGWICPKCGGGVAPTVQRCPCSLTSPVLPFWPPQYNPPVYGPNWVAEPTTTCGFGPRSEDC